MPTLNVHYLPDHVEPEALADKVVVVIDLLRASSTICQALASGARCVVPFVEVAETRRAAAAYKRHEIVLGGERGGRIIDGFDLGNSPLEYTPQAVADCRLLFTTTNGTRALGHARLARRTFIGCALNRRAVARAVENEIDIAVLCAGTDGVITGEDVLAAGAIVHEIVESDRPATMSTVLHHVIDEGAHTALGRWQDLLDVAARSGRTPSEQLARAMRDSPGGSNLLDIGHEADLAACAQLDALSIVPELNRATGEIRPA
jgi:2-phosphosulfolactate phosphatase